MSARTLDWGFPRWGEYGRDQDPVQVRLCDRIGCMEKGEHPAPKSPNSREKWHFCERHAAEFNRSYNYFAGVSAEEAERMQKEDEAQREYARANTWTWMGPDGSSAREEALDVLGLPGTATPDEIKRAYRKLAKRYHPDINPGDPEATKMFHDVRAAYDLLKEAA
ncbi:MAG: J domain-containing protein [Sphingomonadales bacterium]